MAYVDSQSYDGRYFRFTVWQSGTSTNVLWKFEVLGGSSSYYSTSPITLKINGKTVKTYSAMSAQNKFPSCKGVYPSDRAGWTESIGEYKTISFSLEGRPYYSSAGTAKTGSLTLTRPTYNVSYSGVEDEQVPESQTKTYGIDLILSDSIPELPSVQETGYTVTFNPNGGTCNTSSLTAMNTRSYEFSEWNTQQDGNGTSYAPGDTYSVNAGVTLYARYISSLDRGSITLPVPTRSGFEFMGWSTSPTDTTGQINSYTPTSTTTLYAVWKASGTVRVKINGVYQFGSVFVKVNGSWEHGVVYVKSSGTWHIGS